MHQRVLYNQPYKAWILLLIIFSRIYNLCVCMWHGRFLPITVSFCHLLLSINHHIVSVALLHIQILCSRARRSKNDSSNYEYVNNIRHYTYKKCTIEFELSCLSRYIYPPFFTWVICGMVHFTIAYMRIDIGWEDLVVFFSVCKCAFENYGSFRNCAKWTRETNWKTGAGNRASETESV